MANAAKPVSVLLPLVLTIILFSFFSTMKVKGFSIGDEISVKLSPRFSSLQTTIAPEVKEKKLKNSRRLLIGSTAPICSYNECRGCKYKCRAEQVPVEANDPINSAYHYKCVCHR